MANPEEVAVRQAAEVDEPHGDDPLEDNGIEVEAGTGLAPETITSHVLNCRQATKWSKSTFVCHSTDVVYYRCAFYDGNMVRLHLTPWMNFGSYSGGTTLIRQQGLTSSRVRRALVLWQHEDERYDKWASC